jgi:plastocyanin
MKRINILFLLSLFLSLVSAARVPVSIIDFTFVPDTVQIFQYDTVVWTNNGNFSHTSTSGVNGVWDSIWDSGTLSHGQSYSRAFTTTGNFHYFCRFHYMSGMVGLVKVSSAGINEGKATTDDFYYQLKFNTNPFQLSTKITYFINSPGISTLKIYDVLGNQIKAFNLNSTGPGWHSIIWDGKDKRHHNVAGGVYFCRLNSDNKEITKKLLKLQ